MVNTKVTNFGLGLVRFCMSLALAQQSQDFSSLPGKIIYNRTTASLHEPVFHIYEQDGVRYIINRGSTDACDFVADGEMVEMNTTYGTFHTGFYKSAEYVYKYSLPYIKGFTGPVYFVGHSMGGAVSTILQIMYATDIPNQDFNTIAFAPVPAADTALNATFADKIISFANDQDIVPTLSIPNMYNLLKKRDPLIDHSPRDAIIALFKDIMSVVEITHALDQELYDAILEAFPDDLNSLLDYGKGAVRVVRYPLGTVIRVSRHSSTPMDNSIVDPISEYEMLRVKLTCISDHFLQNYGEAIDKIPDE